MADNQSIAPKLEIPTHPLANSKLGALLHWIVSNEAEQGDTANWITTYYYENGYVRMEVVQNKYNYETWIDEKEEKEQS